MPTKVFLFWMICIAIIAVIIIGLAGPSDKGKGGGLA